MILTHFGFTT